MKQSYFPTNDATGAYMGAVRDPLRHVIARFAGSARQFGLMPPPVPLRVKLLPAGDVVTLLVQTIEPAPPGPLVDWAPQEGLLRFEFGARRVFRLDYRHTPEELARVFQGVQLELARLSPDGEATVTIWGPRASVAAFATRLGTAPGHARLVNLHASRPRPRFLTRPQEDALRLAVAAGYYRIPRTLNLHDLAGKMRISSASLSERLRRAEGRVITSYAEHGLPQDWEKDAS